jgi:ABC-2 type transport system permease protein
MIALVLTLAAKDWRLFWADRKAAGLCFVVPVVLASTFGILFHRPSHSESNVKLPLAVVAEDDGTLTAAVVADLLASPRAEATIVTRAEAERLVADRRPGVAVVFPAGFERVASLTRAGTKPNVEILHNPLCATEAQWAEGVVAEVVMKRIAKSTFGPIVGELATDPPYRTDAVPVTGSAHAAFNSYAHSFSGMTLQYLLFWGMESGLLLLRERNRGVWLRTRAAPVPLGAVLAGKALATASVALLQVAVTFGFGRLAFGVTVSGSWLGFLALAGSISLLAAATGLLVAAVGGTEGRARSVSILVILGVSMVGGLWVPAFLLPGWARDVALAVPTTWAMRGLDGATWQGRGLGGTLPFAAAVAGFALACLALAALRLASLESNKRKGFSP